MKYIGTFKDVNDKPFTITIISNEDESASVELLLGDTPIITEVEGEDNLFKPVKYSCATIKLLSKDLMYDIYSSKAQGTKVTLSDPQGIRWTGYLTPNLYNLGFEYDLEEIELEAIDGLSTLQYIDYITPKKLFRSFTTIISSILEKCNCYKYFYLPFSYLPDEKTVERFFSKCQVSEANFFDEDDEPMKCDEVLLELCKFMGVTAVAYGLNVYFLDYDAIKLDYNEYYKIEVGKEDDGTLKMLLQNKQSISKDSYAENGALINLGLTYSKVSVKDSLYSAADVFPKVDDLKLLKNKNGANQYQLTINQYPNKEPDKSINAFSFNKFYSHPYFIEHWYNPSTLSQIDNFTPKCYNDLFTNVGGNIIKNYTASFYPSLTVEEQKDNIKQLDFKPYILISNLKKDDGQIRPLLTIDIPNPVVMGGKRTFLVLNGSVIFKRDKFDTCTEQDIQFEDDLVDNNNDSLYINICAMLKVGNKYFTSSGEWSDYKSWFMIPLQTKNKPDEKIHFFNNDYQFDNNINYLDNLQVKDGYAILLPDNIITSDCIEFSFIQPIFTPTNIKYDGYLLSDFSASIEVANRQDDVIFESDTEYINVINSGFVNDFEGEDFKVCTWDNKQANFSSVIYNDGEPKYLDKIYSKATRNYMRSEELYIDRILRQNSLPPYILEMTVYNNVKPYSTFTSSLLGGMKRFVVDSQSIDWRLDTNHIKLVEKK